MGWASQRIEVSITNTKEWAMAFAVGEGEKAGKERDNAAACNGKTGEGD